MTGSKARAFPNGTEIVRLVRASFEDRTRAARLRGRLGASERQVAVWRKIFLQGGEERLRRALETPKEERGRRIDRDRFRLVRAALGKHAAAVRRLPNVVGVAVGRKRVRGRDTLEPCLTVLVERKWPREDLKPEDAIPALFRIDLGRGRKEEVPVDVVETGTFAFGAAATPLGSVNPVTCPGGSIAHSGYPNENSGTLGCLVLDLRRGRRGALNLLSCFHVLQPPGNGFQDFDVDVSSPQNETIVTPSREDAQGEPVTAIAVLIRGRRDRWMDAGIAMLLNPGLVDPRIGGIAPPVGARSVLASEIGRTSGQFFGRSTPHGNGLLRLVDASIDSPGAHIEGLIAIDRCSMSGDSGAVVLDLDWNVLGLLIGSTKTHTYLVPFQRMAASLGCKLVTA